jgi:hypothetical protein
MIASITAGFQYGRRQFHVTGSLNVGIVVAVVGFPDRVGNDRGGGDGTWFGSSDVRYDNGRNGSMAFVAQFAKKAEKMSQCRRAKDTKGIFCRTNSIAMREWHQSRRSLYERMPLSRILPTFPGSYQFLQLQRQTARLR